MRSLLFASLLLFACPGPVSSVTELCKAGAPSLPAAPAAIVTGRRLASLSMNASALVYVDPEGRGTLRRAALDGTNDTVLYGPPGSGKKVFDAMVVDDTVYFFEQETLLTTTTRLLRVPLAGGTVTAVDLTQPAVFFVKHAPTENAFYVKTSNSGSAMSTVFKMTPDGVLTSIVGPKNVENALITADNLFFMYRPDIGDDASSRALHKAKKEAGATDAALGSVFCRSSFFVTESGAILCSGYSSTGTGSPSSAIVTKLDAAGANATTLLDLKADGFGGAFLSASAEVGDELVFSLGGASDTYPLLAVKLATGAVRALACDAPAPELKTGTARPEIVTNADSVFWIGAGPSGVGNNTLFKAALR